VRPAPLRVAALLVAAPAPLAMAPAALAQDTGLYDDWELYRVDVPDYPGALASSEYGSVLAAPPEDGTPWRVESVPQLDEGAGYVTWEALEALDASPWHDAGYRGQGVKVAIFDLQWYGFDLVTEELGDFESHDCWAHDGCTPSIDSLRPRFSSEVGVHGVACAEVVHDIAPDAEIHLVRVNGQTTFESAAAWAVRNEIDVVSMSLSFFANSFYDGSGPIADTARSMIDGDVLLVTSAGNYAESHWMEDFLDTDGDGYHEFPWGSEYLPIELSEGSKKISVEWDQHYNCGDTDLDVYVYADDGRLVGRSTATQDGEGSCEPVERVYANADYSGWYYLRLERVRGDPATRFIVWANSGEIYKSIANGSIADPGVVPEVLTVAAVKANGYMQNAVEGFSSWGPTNAGVDKPDIAGPDGLTTSAYGNTGFYGTSAATPALAGAIALVMSREPELSAFEAAARLEGWASNDRATWEPADQTMGAGRARLPDPLSEGLGCARNRPWFFAGLLFLPVLRRRRRN
jgi:hypothetical protein